MCILFFTILKIVCDMLMIVCTLLMLVRILFMHAYTDTHVLYVYAWRMFSV